MQGATLLFSFEVRNLRLARTWQFLLKSFQVRTEVAAVASRFLANHYSQAHVP